MVAAVLVSMIAPTRAAESRPALIQWSQGYVSPIDLVELPGTNRVFLVADQIGVIHVVSAQGSVRPEPFLDLRGRLTKLNQGFDERGLLGMALHPRFAENRRFFVFYSAPLRTGAPADWDHTGRVSEFKVAAGDPLRADPASERLLLEIDEPHFNHNGGRLAFGPDGYLYIGVGDGGAAHGVGKGHSPKGNGQDPHNLLGKILRIDIDHGDPYALPPDNPLMDQDGRPEIYAWGLRNPWGLTFDRGGSHELFVADVGQDAFEEVDIVTKGGNYGWNLREGFICFDPQNPLRPPADCPKVNPEGQRLIDPILAYKNFKRFAKDPEAKGISVTGGYVYRGSALPQFVGAYVFGDWSRSWTKAEGSLFVARRPADNAGPWNMAALDLATHPGGIIPGYVIALGQDLQSELYVMTNDSNAVTGRTGKIYRLTGQ
jgi:glucose/arabinose dehydrogenase